MKSLLEYPFLAILLLVFSGIFLQEDNFDCADDTNAAYEFTQDLYECNRYQHAEFEPQKNICIAANRLSSAQSSIRVLKKNKRSTSSAKCHLAALKTGKHNSLYQAFNLSHNKYISFPYPAEPGNQLIRFCSLII